MKKPVCIIVRDGWGINEKEEGNAAIAANTPNCDKYKEKYPYSVLKASGEAVGLPAGFQGSSEVGHLNMGAGRIVVQEMKRVFDGIDQGTIFKSDKWKNFIADWKENQSSLHLMGLLQDQGVHAHQDHLFTVMREARKEYPEGKIVIHPFLDGRDTPPKSSATFIKDLEAVMEEVGNCQVGTAMGRFYGMDRSENWDITDKAFNCIVNAKGRQADDLLEAVKYSYEHDKTPDNVDMFDEYIPPHVFGDYQGVGDGDCVFHTNYRQDRAIQLTKAFVESDYPGSPERRPEVSYLGMTQYYDEFDQCLIESMTSGGGMENLLGQVISEQGLKQLRIAETQKFRHVTSFFNGKKTTPYENEDQVEIKSKIDPSAYASQPQMEAYKVTEEVLKRLEDNPYDLVVINFANGDMVGHTGNFEAAKKAIEVVDECVGKVVDRVLEIGGELLVTADHGNSEQMIDYETGEPKTAHTTFPVECFYISNNEGVAMKEDGILSDIATTALKLKGIDIPEEMTADVLVKE
ncbi:MAG: 2,3-bisphosphoglycerate-independent phosphoglycerate mutase [Candidatus Marinimicrobia bacterium]|nr:2,3-bisphosphoglycerate-independent phosphoglycerate mutase [Candidatus Neomarinimicrobiota bacterium]